MYVTANNKMEETCNFVHLGTLFLNRYPREGMVLQMLTLRAKPRKPYIDVDCISSPLRHLELSNMLFLTVVATAVSIGWGLRTV